MSINMSYCKFENTLAALRECMEDIENEREDLSDSEAEAKEKLMVLCAKIGYDINYEQFELDQDEV